MKLYLFSTTALSLLLASSAFAQTTFSAAHPVFLANCTPCHVTLGSGGLNIATSNINQAYASSQLISYYVPGQTKGFASLVRIQDGSMPQAAGCTGDPALDVGNSACLTAAEQAVIQAWINDGQLGPSTGSRFCFGDGSGTPCPCGNSGSAQSGCANSVVANGGRLIATGTARVTSDTLVLRCSQLPNSPALYFQGTSQVGGGLGASFGDGLQCAGGSLIRLGTKTSVSNASVYPVAGDPSVSVQGAVPASGGTRHYQVLYRNAAVFCQPETFNLTNGLSITWIP